MLPTPRPWSYGSERCWSERGRLPCGNPTGSGDCAHASEPAVRGGRSTRGTGPRSRGRLCHCYSVGMRRGMPPGIAVTQSPSGGHWGFCECFLTRGPGQWKVRQPDTHKTTQGPRSHRCEDLAHYHQANDHAQLKRGINGKGAVATNSDLLTNHQSSCCSRCFT